MSLDPRTPSDMSLVEHLDELRWRLIKAFAALAVGFIACFSLHRQIILWLTRPVGTTQFIFTAPPEYFVAALKVAFFAGLYLALPVILYQVVAFVLPGLTPQEQRWVLPIAAGSFLLFTLGGAFSYYVLLPAGLHFLLGFAPGSVVPMLSVGTYLGFAASLVFATGLVFELPLVLLAFAWAGIVNSRMLASFRRGAIVAAVALGAVITPSADIFSQVLLAGALYGLYELSVALVRLIGK